MNDLTRCDIIKKVKRVSNIKFYLLSQKCYILGGKHLKSIKDTIEKTKLLYNSDCFDGWIKWFHTSIPDKPEGVRLAVRTAAAINGHCLVCTGLSGCYFKDDYKEQSPKHPQHNNCHCKKIKAKPPFVKAYCDIRKFSDYIFAERYTQNGKGNLFIRLGFKKEDSARLKIEFENQARTQYSKSNYTLGKLDKNGQRMTVEIQIKHSTRGVVKFLSGWMIRPNGYITCNTPLGG